MEEGGYRALAAVARDCPEQVTIGGLSGVSPRGLADPWLVATMVVVMLVVVRVEAVVEE